MKSAISKSNVRKTVALLKSNMECKVCFNPIIGYVWQCGNGHIVCKDCNRKCHKCPFCKETINSRNLLLEHLFENFTVSCPNTGCKHKSLNVLMKQHMTQCKFTKIKCIFCNDFLEPKSESIIDHMEKKHNAKSSGSNDFPVDVNFSHDLKNDSVCLSWCPRIFRFHDTTVMLVVKSTYNNYTISIHCIDDFGERNIQSVMVSVSSERYDTKCLIKNIPSIRNWKDDTHFTVNKNNTIVKNEKRTFCISLCRNTT